MHSLGDRAKVPQINLSVCCNLISFKIDTGASINVIDYETYVKMSNKPKLEDYEVTIYPYGCSKPLKCFGKFSENIVFKGEQWLSAKF